MLHYKLVNNKYQYFRGFLMSGMLMHVMCPECLCMINVERHAAHCRVGTTTRDTMSNDDSVRHDRRTQHEIRIYNLATKCLGVPGTRERLPVDGESLRRRPDVFFYFFSKIAFLKTG